MTDLSILISVLALLVCVLLIAFIPHEITVYPVWPPKADTTGKCFCYIGEEIVGMDDALKINVVQTHLEDKPRKEKP